MKNPAICEWPTGCPDPAGTRNYCTPHYKKLWYTGRIHSTLIDAAPTRDRINTHLARGRTIWSLAHESGVDNKALRSIHEGHTTHVRTRTAERIHAVPPPATPIGCLRRIQALAALGHTRAVIAHAAGCTEACIKTILYRGRSDRVTSPVADGIRTAYQHLSTTQGPSTWVARLAARNGYLPPWCWAGLDIDDPTTQATLTVQGPPPAAPRFVSVAYVAHRIGADIGDLERTWERAAS